LDVIKVVEGGIREFDEWLSVVRSSN
jgi:hypothetical protein